MFPFLGQQLRGGQKIDIIGCEPLSCPSFTKGKYAYDHGDMARMTPLIKIHTLGSDFLPPANHSGGLRYHGMSYHLSHLYELGLMRAKAYGQKECFEAGVIFGKQEGIIPGLLKRWYAERKEMQRKMHDAGNNEIEREYWDKRQLVKKINLNKDTLLKLFYRNLHKIEGTVHVTAKKFLHLYFNLWHHVDAIGQAPMSVPNTVDLIKSRKHGYMELIESRRMRSSELHYLDHPKIGIIAQIEEVKLPSALEELFALSTKTSN